MGSFAKGIVITLALMSIWSLTIMVAEVVEPAQGADAKRIKFAPEFSQFLEEDNLTEAIRWPRATRSRTSPSCSAARSGK